MVNRLLVTLVRGKHVFYRDHFGAACFVLAFSCVTHFRADLFSANFTKIIFSFSNFSIILFFSVFSFFSFSKQSKIFYLFLLNFFPLYVKNTSWNQWCSKTTKLQDHLFFPDQDHFFKTKIAFLKTIKLLTQNH